MITESTEPENGSEYSNVFHCTNFIELNGSWAAAKGDELYDMALQFIKPEEHWQPGT